MEELDIPASVTKIGSYVFAGCDVLKNLELPEGVTDINRYAFYECMGLETLVIPASVKTIGGRGFAYCENLKEIKVKGAIPANIGSSGEDVFYGTYFARNNEKGIKVPKAALADYQSAWSEWAEYIEGYSIESGKINSEAKADADSPVKGAELTNSKEEILNASGIFTEAEKEQIANGADANVWLELKKVDMSTVSDTDKAAILKKAANFMGEGTELTYFDASLFKQITGQAAQKVSEPGISMKLTIKIPTELLTTDTNVNRTYTIIRLHNGQAEEITGAFDAASGSFTFETDKFSTYAIAYKDTVKSNGGSNGGNGNNGGNNGGDDDQNAPSNNNNNQTIAAGNTTNTPSTGADSTNASATNGTAPKTGDSSAMMAWAVLAVVSLAGIVVFRKKRA